MRDPEQHLRDLEESLWIAETRYDDVAMGEIFAPSFVEIGHSGRRYLRDEMFLGGYDGEVRIEIDWPLRDFQVEFLTQEVAIVTYRSVVRYPDFLQHAHRCSIWNKTQQNWQLRYHQGTPVHEHEASS